MDTLEVVPSELRASAKALERAAHDIAEELERLEDAADVLRLTWEGDAQVAFDREQTRLRARMAAHGEQLRRIANAVAVLANSYGETDREAARALGGQ